MAILRNKQKNQYTVITNSTIRDTRLSNKDIGALVRLLALPDGWNFSVNGLIAAKVMPDGKASIGASMRKLEQYGYLRRVQRFNDQGQFDGKEWEVRETPLTEKPPTGKPPTGKPSTENQVQSITDISITDISITECDSTLSQEEYDVLVVEWGRELVDYQIRRITENHYANCMNAATIAQWCREYRERKKVCPPTTNLFNAGIPQNYGNITELEKEILSN